MAVHIILNRWQSRKWGSLEATVKARRQFSVWNTDDPNYVHMVDPLLPRRKGFDKIVALCDLILEVRRQGGPDPTFGANHYHHRDDSEPPPYWARGLQAKVVGKMKIYRL